MKERTSTSAVLDAMDEETKYLTPIFGSGGVRRADAAHADERRAGRAAHRLRDDQGVPVHRGQRHAEPHHVLPNLHGAHGHEDHGRGHGEERHRQGRVPHDGRPREPLRRHDRRLVAREPGRRAHGHLHGGLVRGLHAGRPGHAVPLEEAGDGRRHRHLHLAAPEPGHFVRLPGVLGEVLPLLGHRDAPRAAREGPSVAEHGHGHGLRGRPHHRHHGHPRHHLHRQVSTT